MELEGLGGDVTRKLKQKIYKLRIFTVLYKSFSFSIEDIILPCETCRTIAPLKMIKTLLKWIIPLFSFYSTESGGSFSNRKF